MAAAQVSVVDWLRSLVLVACPALGELAAVSPVLKAPQKAALGNSCCPGITDPGFNPAPAPSDVRAPGVPLLGGGGGCVCR